MAVAVAVDTGRTIEVEVQHRDAPPVLVTLPYRRKVLGRHVDFGPVQIGPAATRLLFPPPARRDGR